MLMCDQYASACACDCTRVRVAEQQRTRGRGFARVCQSLPEVLVCVCVIVRRRLESVVMK